MKTAVDFIVSHWEPITVLVAAIFARHKERGRILEKLREARRVVDELKGPTQ